MRIFNGPSAGNVGYRMEKKQDSSADLYLYDVIGDSWEGTTAKQFTSDLKALGDVKTLNIFINSVGGSVFDGVAIFNALRRHKAYKNVYVDGLAASIASVVAMVGDRIEIASNAMMMIHDPWAAAIIVGNAKDFRETGNKIADNLDRIRDSILGTYVDRTGNEEKDVVAWMRDETWFTADEAVEKGFADVKSEQEVAVAALAKHDFTKFKSMPDRLKKLVDSMQQDSAAEPARAVDSASKLAAIADRQARLATLQI